jgi:dihydroflavonol-4-reductase
MIVDFMRGRIVATMGGGVNVVPVEDVARAHVLALERGAPQERYLVGGDNLSLQQLWSDLARICGLAAPTRRMPYRAALGLGLVDDLRCRITGKAPLVPIEGVRMAQHTMWVSSERARRELGLKPSSVAAALERAVGWYRDHGYAG